jgi:hypothetical protein
MPSELLRVLELPSLKNFGRTLYHGRFHKHLTWPRASLRANWGAMDGRTKT